ncbi:MAG: hypothetical protein BroJett018_24180 [Chloroflexota bacterium]|nr:MAG: hypothetical protein BroJett018_24180 [Chloroflexota bacterium]
MVGMYIVGSLALGDFDPQYSDIDLIVVTETLIESDVLDRIRALHSEFAASDSAWAKRVEAVYPTAKALIGSPSRDESYPQIERDTALFAAPLEDGWVFQCYTLREHGLVVAGPEPHQTLCRMLYSLETGTVASKPKAVQWAQGRLDEKWARLIGMALAHREAIEQISAEALDGTAAFVQYTFDQTQLPPAKC